MRQCPCFFPRELFHVLQVAAHVDAAVITIRQYIFSPYSTFSLPFPFLPHRILIRPVLWENKLCYKRLFSVYNFVNTHGFSLDFRFRLDLQLGL